MADKLDKIIASDSEDNKIKSISSEELEKVTGGDEQGAIYGSKNNDGALPLLYNQFN